MKIQKILLSCLVILTMAFTTSFGSENESETSARQELISNLDNVIEKVPFEKFIGNVRECKMTIIFKVNENSELTNYEISSNNKSLNHITELLLNRAELKADPVLNGNMYRITVSFINQAYH